MRRLWIAISAALAFVGLLGCRSERHTLRGWPPSLGKLSVTQLALDSSSCPSGWIVSYAYDDITHFWCTAEPANPRAPSEYVEISSCCATILAIGVSGDSWRSLDRDFEQIAPLLDDSVAAALRASLSDEGRLRQAAERHEDLAAPIWPNTGAEYSFGRDGHRMVWTLRDFWPQ